MSPVLVVIVAMLIYGFIHSQLASQEAKTLFQKQFGERAYHGFYRLFFSAFAGITFLPIAYLIVFQEGDVVWKIDLAWEVPLMILQAFGVIGFILTLLQIDLGRFVGTTQAQAYFNDAPLPLPPEPLSITGFYAYSRHPLYFFSLFILWPITTMTASYFGFAIGTTLYLLIGSYYEEQRLLHYFGEEYRAYRQKVAWLIPFLHFDNNS